MDAHRHYHDHDHPRQPRHRGAAADDLGEIDFDVDANRRIQAYAIPARRDSGDLLYPPGFHPRVIADGQGPVDPDGCPGCQPPVVLENGQRGPQEPHCAGCCPHYRQPAQGGEDSDSDDDGVVVHQIPREHGNRPNPALDRRPRCGLRILRMVRSDHLSVPERRRRNRLPMRTPGHRDVTFEPRIGDLILHHPKKMNIKIIQFYEPEMEDMLVLGDFLIRMKIGHNNQGILTARAKAYMFAPLLNYPKWVYLGKDFQIQEGDEMAGMIQ